MKLLKRNWLPLVLSLFLFFSCDNLQNDSNMALHEVHADSPIFIDIGNTVRKVKVNNTLNKRPGAKGGDKSNEKYHVALLMAEYITHANSDKMGNIVFFRDVGNKQLAGDFVPGLALDGTDDISYYIDNNRASADLDVAMANNAIDRAMSTWDNLGCSDLGMYKVPYDSELKTGFIASLLDPESGSADYVADINHCGWEDGEFFNTIFEDEGAAESVLGVTFTIVFTDDDGNLIDLDNNGKYDVAWREIYYNDAFAWNDGDDIDVETIALHEAGHGLSQGHFGKLFASGNFEKGVYKFHFSPLAVMNASYIFIQTSIQETDLAGHCSNWSQWPIN
ncbi:hypothetical protein [Aestuariibaculum sediminum]|uniref:Peptidase M10 metallopeptidase domain-containing protein n=1 Tax=Aestuariibaculum sediminum TaxID=2770637 RepID=A0A8J6Q2M4_9FLAO|nr:hypothetical protein [Aestuariibaculum sediminum]MBD0832331.1 hypothetical protein [Aestuariibaculum sediminum]